MVKWDLSFSPDVTFSRKKYAANYYSAYVAHMSSSPSHEKSSTLVGKWSSFSMTDQKRDFNVDGLLLKRKLVRQSSEMENEWNIKGFSSRHYLCMPLNIRGKYVLAKKRMYEQMYSWHACPFRETSVWFVPKSGEEETIHTWHSQESHKECTHSYAPTSKHMSGGVLNNLCSEKLLKQD